MCSTRSDTLIDCCAKELTTATRLEGPAQARGRVEWTHVRRMCRSGRARLLYMQTGTRNAGQGVEWKGRQVCGRCILARARGWSFLDTYRVSLSTLQSEYTTTPVAHFEVTWLVKPKEMSNARTTLGIHVHTSTMNTTSAAQLFAATYSPLLPHFHLARGGTFSSAHVCRTFRTDPSCICAHIMRLGATRGAGWRR